MDGTEVARRRLHSARLAGNPLASAEQVVRWFGAVQSQDYGPAKWSLGQRLPGATDAELDAVFDSGAILRTHALRPTWHFVDPADIRWLQRLTGPRVEQHNATRYRQLELDEGTLTKTTALLVDALQGGAHLTRRELTRRLEAAGVNADGQRMAYILMHAELNAVICSGARDGRQHTYALLDERAPPAPDRSRDEALAELTLRFFTGHGPATAKDFRWWSSLTLADIKAGLDMVGGALQRATVDGVVYWFAEPDGRVPGGRVAVPPSPDVQLLQGYDEYVVAFTESKHVADASGAARGQRWDRPMYTGIVILDGQLAGHWKRTVGKDSAMVRTYLYEPFDQPQTAALHAAAQRHARFLGLPVTVL